jgi:2-polyprenyl-6-methoxyphenol hydroxylase-like FAD-dependent oxidoreductase
MVDDFDVVVVGSGPAGCTAATLLGRNGLQVALLEAHRDRAHYKRLCTHSIRSSAMPTLRRLGVVQGLDDLGAVHHHERGWTGHGWFHERVGTPHGYNVRRLTMDPFLRATAAAVPGVEVIMGAKVRDVTTDADGRISGVVADVAGVQQQIGARLVIGADGYTSKVAALAGLPGKSWPNIRFAYQAGYLNVGVPPGWTGAAWYHGPGLNYIFCNNDGLTVLAAFPVKDRLAEFKEDREAALLRTFAALPDGPDMSGAERVTDVIGTTDYPCLTRRRIVRPGVALVGDAAMVGDPVWGVGCGWAFQTAEWLSDAVAEAVRSGEAGAIDAAAKRYQRKHRRKLLPHQITNIDFSRRRRANPLQRLLYVGAARDQKVADRILSVGTRNASPATLLDPILLARAAVASRRPASR